jgi:hypothetical protein
MYFDGNFCTDGQILLRNAHIGVLADDKDSWPPRQELGGLTYGDLHPYLPARKRLHWLGRSAEYQGQPFEELAAYYQRLGHDEQARRVLLAQQRARNRRPMAGPLVGMAPGRARRLRIRTRPCPRTPGRGARRWLGVFQRLPPAPSQSGRTSIIQRCHLHHEPANPRSQPRAGKRLEPPGDGAGYGGRATCSGLATRHHRDRSDYTRRRWK